MKFQPDRIANANVIGGYTRHSVQVGERAWHESLLLPWQGEVRPWEGARFDRLDALHFDAVAALQPELVLFGSGATLRFPRPEWLRALIERRIGFETMDTAAACRTYNLLAAEGRAVVAALLIEPAGDL
jgi:uncharacterized protein